MLRKGYSIEHTTIEIYEGNLDLIFYNDPGKKRITFYYHRWKLNEIFPQFHFPEDLTITDKDEVAKFLKSIGFSYNILKNSLIEIAKQTNKKVLYDM